MSAFPPSPPTFGAQRRIQGLMAGLARRHDVSAVSLIGSELDAAVAERAMREYCREVVLVPSRPTDGVGKRLIQLRSLASRRSFERHFTTVPALARALDRVLTSRRFDVVSVETPALCHYPLQRAPPGERPPRRVLDNHNIEYDLVRQMASTSPSPLRRFYNSVNWPKVRDEEVDAWQGFDGVTFTSSVDEARARSDVPAVHSTVIPNAVDVEFFRPRPGDPTPDGRTVLFFGTVDYFPNRDGINVFLRDVWPAIAASHPAARLKIVGPRPTPEVLAARGPRIEVTGLVDDLRPHLAEAALTIVPLRIGGGTRLKVLEAMAMAKPIVSTTLGAEGIDVASGREVLLADEPPAFAAAVGRLLDDPALGERLGRAARALAEARYSWNAAADELERFFLGLLDRAPRA